jgi:polyhydroxyalkanoate synthesis regulator protein
MDPARDPVTIKLYANRRLYRPTAGRYVTRGELVSLAARGVEIVVRDAKTGVDVTGRILSRNRTEH